MRKLLFPMSLGAITLLVAACSPYASAQDAPVPPPPGADAPPPPPPGGPRPPGPPRGASEFASFDIRLGHGSGMKVECGREPIRACIESALPLIDKVMPLVMMRMGHGMDDDDRRRQDRDDDRRGHGRDMRGERYD